jgi:hypothetical protein
MAIGIVIYLAYGRRHSVLAGRDADVKAVVQLGNNPI